MDSHAIVIVDAAGVIRMWSEGATRLFGYDAASAVGKSLDLIIPESHRERHWMGFRAAIRSGNSKLDSAAANLPVLRKDGSVAHYAARLIFLRDAKQEVVGAAAIYSPNQGGNDPSLPTL
ncbi:MAG TPA: PAS domain S-box protein [Candidatus Binataceae bacterium]|nr:PAS domain S-box protein [Candidatus Binataceae bacterium]